ncbi:hypothetical protein DNTS_003525 [Danionella cerebrum]|uniref:BCL-11A-like CCHC zinc finger domain-containing protein n=1 Tax=Danionella cerebrum TaxID=2873325 RepID=A0A553P5K0_9TELE|nr:hypothetical protein DNTS_003525 [Danionella translucida]
MRPGDSISSLAHCKGRTLSLCLSVSHPLFPLTHWLLGSTVQMQPIIGFHDPPSLPLLALSPWVQQMHVYHHLPLDGQVLRHVTSRPHLNLPQQRRELPFLSFLALNSSPRSHETLALPNVNPAEPVANMSRRKQGKPLHLSKREFSPEPVTGDIPEVEGSRPGSKPCTPKGDQDLLTCGQCGSRFPLADILLFIEHKRRECQGRLCMDKSSGLAPSPPPAGQRRASVPVEMAVQVSPHGEEHLALTPHGLRPKQESLTEWGILMDK